MTSTKMDISLAGHKEKHRTDSNKTKSKSLQYNRPSSESADVWDSLESDTESLLQEKAYQRELQKKVLHGTSDRNTSYDAKEKMGTKSFEFEECSDPHNTDPQPGGIMKHGAADRSRYLPRQRPNDKYDDQLHNPEHREKLEDAEILRSDISFDSSDELEDSLNHTEDSHKYVLVNHSSTAEMDALQPRQPLMSFHLHSQQDQNTLPQVLQSSYMAPESRPLSNSDKAVKVNLLTSQKSRSRKFQASRPTEDIVERNITTLGMNRRKQGSYLKAFEQRGRKADDANQSAEDTASTDNLGSPDNSQDPEPIWIQKTPKLKFHQIDNQKNPSAIRSRSGDHLNQAVEKWVLMDDQQSWTSSDSGSISNRSLAPTINPNINLNTLSKPAKPFLKGYNSPLIGSSYPRSLHHSVDDAVALSASESTWETNKSSVRVAQKWPSVEANSTLNVPGIHLENEDGDALQTYGGTYPVLPPIGMPEASDTGLSSDRTELGMNAIRRTSSDGYLAQLQKQTQLKTTYKAYLLKDYKSLTKEVKLGGLGPSHTVAEDMAEKIRRQKLYSNVIRDQNKKIRRIPFLPARSPVGSEKDTVPRNKALEYAKTIVRPKATQQRC
ncbi:jhy protein homolog isoform X2 [Trichomycterus rosablanca]|uniref:jhy protein homolog isoform X2 n=1 Tax=Trichomycterus rosablanca TaxID=2290929 RepID=UPI002F358F5C